jgi:hypothetical protein
VSIESELPTTSAKLANKLHRLLQDQGGFRKLEVLHPEDGLRELGAPSSLVIITADGVCFGLECTPFGRVTTQGPATVRGVDGATEGA